MTQTTDRSGAPPPGPDPRRRGGGRGGEGGGGTRAGGPGNLARIAFLLAPLVAGVILLYPRPVFLAVFVVLFLGITAAITATSLARCRHCGYLIFGGFGMPAGMIRRCPRCGKGLYGRR